MRESPKAAILIQILSGNSMIKRTLTTVWTLDFLLDWILLSMEYEESETVKTEAFFTPNGKFIATITKIYEAE